MTAIQKALLSDLILTAQSGFASGEKSESGIAQIRMHNVTTEGRLDFSNIRRVPKDTVKDLSKYLLKPGDVLFNNTNSPNLVGKTALFVEQNEPFAFSNHFVRLVANPKKLDSSFLARWLTFQQQQGVFELLCTRWVNQAAVRREDLLSLSIPLPPLAEQQRIAAILDKADALRAKRRTAVGKLDTLLQSTFLHMFGDPVTNPMGWPVNRLDSFGTVLTGSTPSRKNLEYYGSSMEWIKSDNINTPHHILTPAEECLSELGAQIGRTVPANSILVTCIAGSPDCIGNAAIADRQVSFNQQINALTPTSKEAVFFLYVQFLIGKKLVQRASTNSMKGMVSKSAFSSIKFISPPTRLQREFSLQAAKIVQQLEIQFNSVKKLDNLFHSLQQRAFKGEL
jgi:type I restriction enzyme, S subunit